MKKSNVLYLDAYNLLIATNAVSYMTDGNSNPCGMYIISLNLIRTFIEKFKPIKVFFVLDGPEAGQRRRELYPNYKNKRRVTERESKVQIMEGDDNMVYGVEGAFQNQMIKIYEFLKLLPITVVSIPFAEADDVISYLSLKNKEEFENIIISNDRDYLQLIQEGIQVYRWKMKKLYTEKDFIEEHIILPSNYIYKKILLGDTSDVIEGIKGIGKKTFDNFASQLSQNTFENIDVFFEHFKVYDFTGYKTREKNAFQTAFKEENKNTMQILYDLMKLDEKCMTEEQIGLLKEQIEEQYPKVYSRFVARAKLLKDVFSKLYNGFDEDKWLQPFVFVKNNTKVNV